MYEIHGYICLKYLYSFTRNTKLFTLSPFTQRERAIVCYNLIELK